MKLIKNEKTEDHHEIEIIKTFLFWSWKIRYRKVNGEVFRYSEPNDYKPTGVFESLEVRNLFYAKVD